jgi:glycerol-3-phosphate acyltransferase PlsY
LRTQGTWFALRVILIDIGKGVLPPLLLPTLALPGVPLDPELSRTWLMLACASASVVGHCYPVWFGFAGGKGAATAVGALLGIAPALAVPGVLVWVFVLVTTGYVGLATMLAAVALPLWLLVSGLDGRIPLLVFLTGLALFIVFTHRANIRRLRAGNENRIEKAMLLRRRPR